jgi:hypothetical protein
MKFSAIKTTDLMLFTTTSLLIEHTTSNAYNKGTDRIKNE